MGLDSPGCNSCSAQLPTCITAKTPSQYLITRAHSFRGTRNFEPSRGIWVFPADFEPRNLTAEFVFFRGNPAEFDVFHSNSYFFTENDLKVALLQVCL